MRTLFEPWTKVQIGIVYYPPSSPHLFDTHHAKPVPGILRPAPVALRLLGWRRRRRWHARPRHPSPCPRPPCSWRRRRRSAGPTGPARHARGGGAA